VLEVERIDLMATLPAIGYADEHETEISYKCPDCCTDNEVTNRIPWGMQCELFAEAKRKRESPANKHQKPSQEKEPQIVELFKMLGIDSNTSMEHSYLAVIACLDQAETLANSAMRGAISAESALKIGELKQHFIEEFAKANERMTLAGMREKAETAQSVG